MNQSRQGKPFRLWTSPLTAADLAAELRFSDLLWDTHEETLVWREERSDRGVLVCQSQEDSSPRDLTGELSVRARVGYGGGDFTVSHGSVYFVAEGRLYQQAMSGDEAKPITPAWGQCAAPTVSPRGEYLLYVHSADRSDVLALVDSQGEHWPVKLHQGHDFYMQPCWHPQGNRIAWVAWNHPHMPWDSSALYLGEISSEQGLPVLTSQEIVAGELAGDTAIFQPTFSPDGRHLSYASNESGWFNVYLLDLNSGNKELVVGKEAEYGAPAWIQGLRRHAWTADGKALYLLRSKEGFTSLVRFDLETGTLQEMKGDTRQYSSLSQIALSPQEESIALIASSSTVPSRIISVSPAGQVQTHQRSSSKKLSESYLSHPQSLSWSVDTDSSVTCCYGLYYPPSHPEFENSGPPATIIKIHGGPTSQFAADYHADTQFFTSRGFAVLELNYRGSWGYGKAYVDALKGTWGVIDVEDTRSAADYLVSKDLAHRKQLILMGGSAGGFTVLLSLIAYPGFFRAGICRYGVSNLFTMTADTHKFEEHYLDSLVGTLPQDEKLYRERSPVFSAHKIRDPLAIFQGEDDQVVPRAQSDEIVQSLAERGVPHLYRTYEGEGHGWRKSETIQDYYESLEQFLSEHLGS
ncbi:MAG: prolyl oligopeptidase family serine peptidase [Acidobacteria bacterium]|nr:prolyl oligopeptidase family serine peptidase [Acidobacteriota bacterium]